MTMWDWIEAIAVMTVDFGFGIRLGYMWAVSRGSRR